MCYISLWLHCKSHRIPRVTPGIILGVIYRPPLPRPNQPMINHLHEIYEYNVCMSQAKYSNYIQNSVYHSLSNNFAMYMTSKVAIFVLI